MKQPTVPPEASTPTEYIHGRVDRRSFLSQVRKVAVAALAAVAIVDQLMPNQAPRSRWRRAIPGSRPSA